MHTFRESASVSENASWHPNRDYRYHPSHNPIHGLNRRIIPLRFALLPYLHKGGSLSQRPRSLSLSLSRACASGFAYTPLLRTRHEAPPFPGLLSSGFAFGPLVHTTGVWLSNIERLSTGGPLGSPVSFSTVSAAIRVTLGARHHWNRYSWSASSLLGRQWHPRMVACLPRR